jgi:hypothetical protein
MNQEFEKLCDKHELNDESKHEFKQFFENEIIRVFYKLSLKKDELSLKKDELSLKKDELSLKKDSSNELCMGKKVSGENCTFKAKENGYCGRHNPDKEIKEKSSKPKKKKEHGEDHKCNAIILKTKKPCIQPGTIQPDNSENYYCKRHSEKWKDFENNV